MNVVFVVICALTAVKSKSVGNNTAILISKYAKVAHWGSTSNHHNATGNEEGRNSRGQYFWTHRSDANVIGGQNIRSKPVAYQYAVYKKPDSKLDHKLDDIPAKGEVIQDRFEGRPLFSFKKLNKQPSATYGAPDAAPSAPAAPPPPPSSPSFDSFPVYSGPSPKPSADPYTSPYSSYNAPDVTPDDSKNQYPPNGGPDDSDSPPGGDSYAQPPPDATEGGMYPPAKKPKVPDSYPSVGPPFAPEYNEDDNDMMPPADTMPKYNGGGPPDHPPKSEDDVYYPPDDSMSAMPDNDHAPKGAAKPNGGDMTMDLVPPPSDHGYPTYLYDQHGFDHQVYEEVPHTTPAPDPGDERVNKGHYSYYYLGRKLWYIPLYFSIYFILYVTVLIFKSIARHKVQFKKTWASDHGKKRESRHLNLEEKVDEVHRNVSFGIENATQKYADVIAM